MGVNVLVRALLLKLRILLQILKNIAGAQAIFKCILIA